MRTLLFILLATSSLASTNWVEFTATAYCSCKKCCGPNAQGITASGHKLKRGDKAIAVDKTVIKFKSDVEIQGLGTYKALDTGSAIKGNILDIWMESHQAALDWGRRKVMIRVKE